MRYRTEVVAVIGGGASGVLTAVHLMRAAPLPVRVVLVEPREALGAGVAYGTPDESHLLNVRAGSLSAWPEEPGHFTSWVRRHAAADGRSFLPREWYGRYLRSLLEPVEHIHARAEDVTPDGGRARIALSNGRALTADRVVLALGASPTAWPERVGESGPRWIRDPWEPGAIGDVQPGHPVLLVGTGLTAVDVALSLLAAGHGEIFATSRHGLLPLSWPDAPAASSPLLCPTGTTVRSLLAWARATAAELGDWGPVIDTLRPYCDALWVAMDPAERVRFLRHVHRRWEVLRHRMAPLAASRINEMRNAGRLKIVRGAVESARTTPGGVAVGLPDRSLRVGAVINCTGPTFDIRRTRDPLVRRLLQRRLASPGPLNLGLQVDARGALPAGGGLLWLVGPLRRGHHWETTAIPEIRTQVAALPRSMWPSLVAVGA